MIISASRRTDIPAFYSEWFMNRIHAGYCAVPNPFNIKQISWIDLSPDKIDAIVFWTRNPKPFFSHLIELDRLGYRFYFQYTIMDNPRTIDPKSPSVEIAIKTFQELSGLVGADRVIWRYDPIVITPQTPLTYHEDKYTYIAQSLKNYSYRSVISLVDIYAKAKKRINDMAVQGAALQIPASIDPFLFESTVRKMVSIAGENGIRISSCAEDIDLSGWGIQPGKCIDDQYIREVFGIEVIHKKDPTQRSVCGCVVSKDIGMYDSCLFGCQYCYATSSFDRARQNNANHNPQSPTLLGEPGMDIPPNFIKKAKNSSQQLSLWDSERNNSNE